MTVDHRSGGSFASAALNAAVCVDLPFAGRLGGTLSVIPGGVKSRTLAIPSRSRNRPESAHTRQPTCPGELVREYAIPTPWPFAGKQIRAPEGDNPRQCHLTRVPPLTSSYEWRPSLPVHCSAPPPVSWLCLPPVPTP